MKHNDLANTKGNENTSPVPITIGTEKKSTVICEISGKYFQMKIRFLHSIIGAALFYLPCTATAATFNITNSGFTFSPNSITISEGDTVVFTLASTHNAVEVEQTTWNANGNTPKSGGFSLGFGGGTITLAVPDTYYYVCGPHASLGMKGKIIVTQTTGVKETEELPESNFAYSNSIPGKIYIRYNNTGLHSTVLRVFDLLGREIARFSIESLLPEKPVPVSPLAPGVYIVRISDGFTRDESHKIIVR